MIVGRLAPTPSGQLHLGNAVAFAAAWLSARSQDGRLLLRVEDVDTGRARAGVAHDQRHDLEWLGLTWDEETPCQSTRDYAPWAAQLPTYRCTCTRAMVRAVGGIYPGTCRHLGLEEGALRFAATPGEVTFVDRRWGVRRVDAAQQGDPVLRRRDGVWAYNLAVVADDITDGVTEVVRGADLLDLSAIQSQLWTAMGATPPTWLHSPLVLDADGRKLSGSRGSMHLGQLRARGWDPVDIWRAVLPWLGLPVVDKIEEVLSAFDPRAISLGPIRVTQVGDKRVRWRMEGET
jgi:glutamyl/glutaminyl-tRNA synthetase